MQAALKFFDFPFNGAGGQGAKKIGIKLPDRAADQPSGDENGFMEIMAALTRIPPQELNTSLAQLDWVPVEDATGELAPLIDLTDTEDPKNSILQMLLPRLSTDTQSPQPFLRAAAGFQEMNSDQGKNAGVSEIRQHPAEELIKQALSVETIPPSNTQHQLTQEGVPRAVPTQVIPPTRTPESELAQASTRSAVWIDAIGDNDIADEAAAFQQRIGARLVLTDRASETAGQRVERAQEQINTEPLASDPQPLRSSALGKWLGRDEHDPGKRLSGGPFGRQAVTDHMNSAAQTYQAERSELSIPQERSLHMDRFGSMISERQAVLAQKVSGENVAVAQEAGLQMGEQSKQQRLNPVVRIDTSPAIQEEVFTVKPSEGTEMQMHGNVFREGEPPFDSQLSANAQKAVEASASAKEATPFVDKDTHTDMIRQIVQRMSLKSDRRHSQMVIRLKPDFLGHVRLQVTTEGQQVMVRMDAESAMVKEIVEQNMAHLKAELNQHGLEIEKFDVFVGSDNDGWRSGQQQAGFRQASKRSGQPFNGASSNNESFDHTGNSDDHGPRAGIHNAGEVDYFV